MSVFVDLRFLNEDDGGVFGSFSPVKQMKTPEPTKKPVNENGSEQVEPDVLKVHTSANITQTPVDGDKSPDKPKSVIGRRKSMERSKFGKFLVKFGNYLKYWCKRLC